MLATSLPALPPPATSLLPILHDHRNPDSTNTSDGQNSLQAQQRRARGSHQNAHVRSHLAILANEERILEQRKQAIQTYGYSWLKPAGCTKTMLGRREEEIEREEVERQLREVELQERNAAEMEETERETHQQRQRAQEERGEVLTGEAGDRDLDEEVPDMDAQDEYDEDDEEEDDDEDEEEEEGDLDDEIPEEDSGFAYDTTRDPDTESEENDFASSSRSQDALRPRATRHIHPSSFSAENQEYNDHARNIQQIPAEDELDPHEYEHDLDDDVPDMDDEAPDLDDEVPDADEDIEDDDGAWEHTDTELEESDMDISIMPPGATNHRSSMLPPSSVIGQRQLQVPGRQSVMGQQSDTDNGLRRTSGNVPLPMAPPSSSASQFAGRRGLTRSQQPLPNFTPAQLDSDISVSALISTGNTGMSSIGGNPSGAAPRAWLDPASARRNLFGASRNAPVPVQSSDNGRGASGGLQPSRTLGTIPNLTRSQSGPSQSGDGMTRQVSSGGLFTPSPQQESQRGMGVVEEPRSRTRSGRLLGATRGGNRAA